MHSKLSSAIFGMIHIKTKFIMRKFSRALLLPLLILWLFVVIVFYYWGHQYSLLPIVIGIIRSIWQILILGLFGIGAFGLGKGLSHLIRLRFTNLLEETIYSLGLGLGSMSLIMLVLSMFRADSVSHIMGSNLVTGYIDFGLVGSLSRPI